ncbi:hypothetical protein F4780DRAFT_773803 [Xylariomycetidae sp. FL0641]|nr:hypothetical protein F4780DRAFT_773803 [Xylariomycetidae sp. FL0641]
MQDRIVRVTADQAALMAFYKIEGSSTRHARLSEFYAAELRSLSRAPFAAYAQEEKADYLLLRNYLRRAQRTLSLDAERDAAYAPFVQPFASPLQAVCEARQRVDAVDARHVADVFARAAEAVARCQEHVRDQACQYSRATGWRAARRIDALAGHVQETVAFYQGYDAAFAWWVAAPHARLRGALARMAQVVREVLVGGTDGDDGDAIVGEPIGRAGLLSDLEAEMIPYAPEELLRIAAREYAWCEEEMRKASADLGLGADWRAALERVKNLYAPPGQQPRFVKGLVAEGADYVTRHDLVTVPGLAREAIRMDMIPAARQKLSPFFLGGRQLWVSYPTAGMAHADKLMSLRGNNRHFSRATAFHEMIPGHHLQVFVGERSRPYRAPLFATPFYVEGWALYWEMRFWDRGDFFTSPEDRIGSLFWRMHRCARIEFSINFHLDRWSPEECVRLLVDKVGHERATAEGEVRRSLSGEYSPLYQAGYMLGALQLMKLREEAVEAEGAVFGEKEFHDKILLANVMPIEMLRALLLKKDLKEDFKSTWRFYGNKI